MGHRLLRASILQPLTVQETLRKRLESVAELRQSSSTLLQEVESVLKSVPDIDKLLANVNRPFIRDRTNWPLTGELFMKPISDSTRHGEQRINDLIVLKQALGVMTPVASAIKTASSMLLGEICDVITHICKVETVLKCQLLDPARISRIELMINQVMNNDTTWTKGALALRHQRCYAIKVVSVQRAGSTTADPF